VREKRQGKTGKDKPDLDDLLPQMRAKARDNARYAHFQRVKQSRLTPPLSFRRTPMQWDATKNAGFSSAETPWMRVHDDYKQWNVEVQSKDPNSVNAFYKQLFQLRNDHLVLVYGSFDYLDFDHEDVFAYVKEHAGKKVLVVLNYSGKEIEFPVPKSVSTANAKLLLGTLGKGDVIDGRVTLEAWEGMLFTL
jgi:glycosidase